MICHSPAPCLFRPETLECINYEPTQWTLKMGPSIRVSVKLETTPTEDIPNAHYIFYIYQQCKEQPYDAFMKPVIFDGPVSTAQIRKTISYIWGLIFVIWAKILR